MEVNGQLLDVSEDFHKAIEATTVGLQQELLKGEKEYATIIYSNTKTLLMGYKKCSKSDDKSSIAIMIEQALMAYKRTCINSKREDLIRRYNVMYYYYIAAEKKGCSDLAKDYYVNERTVRRDIKNAVCDMMIHFYGIDGLIALTHLTKQN